jgi:FMN reductase
VAAQSASDAGADVEVLDLATLSLPVMCVGDEAQALLPEVKHIRATASAADGFILTTPEYHGSMSGALKNWFDYLYEELAGKVAGVLATTGGGSGDMSIAAVKTSFQWCHGFVLPFHAAATTTGFVDAESIPPRVQERVERIGYDVVRYARVLRPAFEEARGCAADGPSSGFAGEHGT